MAANLTVTEPAVNGYITAYPDGVSRPNVSNLHYVTGQTVANLAVLDRAMNVIGESAATNVYNQSGGTTQLIIDVFGYFEPR